MLPPRLRSARLALQCPIRWCIVAVVLLSFAESANAQCPQWVAGPLGAVSIGPNAPIHAMIAWNGGPQTLLIVGGEFTSINGVSANHVAAWDGQVWRALGSGTLGPVFSLAVFNGNLYAGGTRKISSSQIPDVETWTGSTWLNITGGLTGQPDTVFALAPFNGQLIGGGHIGGVYRNIASFDGTTWQAMGNGTDKSVYSLAVYNNLLHVGGAFTVADTAHVKFIASWNGSGWAHVDDGSANGPRQAVFAMAVHGSELFLGLAFPSTVGALRWTGTNWQPAGILCTSVKALVEFNGQLYAGGSFDTQDGCTNNRIAQWTGSNWAPVGGGIDPGITGPMIRVSSLVAYNGQLFVGGSFQHAGAVPVLDIAAWNGGGWTAPAAPLIVYALAHYGSKVGIGGYFAQTSGLTPDYYLASWDGSQLSPIGSGVDAPVFGMAGFTQVSGVRIYNNLVVGGAFSQAGGLPASHVATWTETNVYPYNHWSAMGSGFNNDVYALEQFNGRTVAGGAFFASGLTATSFVAAWDGSAWQPMGTGMNGPVRAFKGYAVNISHYALVAGGDFTTANGGSANRIAIWSESTIAPPVPWTALGSGFNGSVNAIERFGGSIYAAGNFTAPGTGGTSLKSIARWNGSAWVAVGAASGGGFNGPVYALKLDGGYLYAAGAFTLADGVTALNVARWDGTSWSAVDVGTDDVVRALSPFQGEMFAGGVFNWAESSALPSPGVARFLETGVPWLTGQPASQTASPTHDVSFSVTSAVGYNITGYAWRKNATPLADGTTPQGSRVFGTNAPLLTIQGIAIEDSGSYDCVVSSACGGVTSLQAILTVSLATGVSSLDPALRPGLVSWPNPTRQAAELEFSLRAPARVDVVVYDDQGRIVRRLLDAALMPGVHRVKWDGLNSHGRTAQAGIYFARVSAGGQTAVRKLVVAR